MRRAKRKPRILHVVHSLHGKGGVQLKTLQLAEGLSDRFHNTLLFPRPFVYGKNETVRSEEYATENSVYEMRFPAPIREGYIKSLGTRLRSSTVEKQFDAFIRRYEFDLVHFHHLANWATFELPLLVKRRGQKTVVSLYDYFLNCPNYNLLFVDKKRCLKPKADPRDPSCLFCLGSSWVRPGEEFISAPAITNYLKERNEKSKEVLRQADKLTVCSSFVKNLTVSAFGRSLQKKIHVIPRGVPELTASENSAVASGLRVGFLGHLTEAKGANTLINAARNLKEENVSFKVFGIPQSASLEERATKAGIEIRGEYSVKKIPQALAEIDVILVLSIWDETYCSVLSEAQSMGIPVIATRVGGLTERIREGETGFLIDSDDSHALSRLLLRLSKDPQCLLSIREKLKNNSVFSSREMIDSHTSLYYSLLGQTI